MPSARYLLILLSFAAALLCHAQEDEETRKPFGQMSNTSETTPSTESTRSPDSANVSYIQYDSYGSYLLAKVDKSLRGFEEYRAEYQENGFYVNTGATGSATLLISGIRSPLNRFQYRQDVFAPYRMRSDSIRFYLSETPYSHIQYWLAKGKEQKLDFNINTKLGPSLFTGITFRFSNAPGLYLRQRAYYPGGNVYLCYRPAKSRYSAIASYLSDRNLILENGGITDLNAFESNSITNRKGLSVSLSKAENSTRLHEMTFQHSLQILKPKRAAASDSTVSKHKYTFDAGRFTHTFRFSGLAEGYTDLTHSKTFYPVSIADTIVLHDTLHLQQLENTVSYSNFEPDTSAHAFPFQYAFGICNTSLKFNTDSSSHNFSCWTPRAALKGILGLKTFFLAEGSLCIGGYNSGDFSLSGRFYQKIGKKDKIEVQVVQAHTQPDFYFTEMSNHAFSWANTLNPEETTRGSLILDFAGYQLDVGLSRIQNYTYLNKKIQPEQYSKGLAGLEAGVKKGFNLGHWQMDFLARVQKYLPDTLVLLPVFAARASLCYDRHLFQNALHLQAGIKALYHSAWNAQAYMPALRAFYLQGSVVSGNYPYADVFVNFQIKRARMFLMYEHFNAAFSGYQYILVPGYPQNDAMFRFGISWMFYD